MKLRSTLLLTMFASLASLLSAQTGLATLTGTITDQTGAVMANATISAKHVDTGTTLTGTTQAAPTTNCYRYILTGTNPLVGPAPTLTTIVMLDTTAPTGGAFTVGGAVASASGNHAASLIPTVWRST